MTQEEKQLLLLDLCARLPYGVKVRLENYHIEEFPYNGTYCESVITLGISGSSANLLKNVEKYGVKPYLRPISSMTEEEWEEFEKEFGIPLGAGANSTSFNVYDYIVIDLGYHYDMYISEMFKMLNWFYSRHYDINNLIKKGLAIEAPKDMY